MNRFQRVGVFLLAASALTASVTAAGPEQTESAAQAVVTVRESSEDWRLLLVNPWNPLPDGYAVSLKRLANGMKVDERIYDDLNAMLIDCHNAGLSPVVCSAYRTHAKQTSLYQNKIARLRAAGYSYETAVREAGRWVAVPGTSEHETGMALDLVSAGYQGLDERQENTPEQKWLMEHSWEYGFILRYPKDKTEITGIGYEPWHYRYVGRENAARIHESGLCLEEYLAVLNAAEADTEETAVLTQETA